MPCRHCEDFTSNSELADSTLDPFEQQSETELDNPTPVSLSDNDEPSPSQYRKEMAMQSAEDSIDEKYEMVEQEECKTDEMFDGDAYDSMVLSINWYFLRRAE